MGNANNPVITRLGINQFWYKHWLSEKNYQNNIKQDINIENIIVDFMNFGIRHNKNFFINNYRFPIKSSKYEYYNIHKYFRRVFYSNSSLEIEHSYLLRFKTAEFFPLKIWIFKFNNWVIISYKWFKPDKTSKYLKNVLKSDNLKLGSTFSIFKSDNNFIRFKILYLWYIKNYFLKKNYYSF